MKLGKMFRNPENGLIMKLKGVHFGINELYPDQVELYIEQTFYVVGTRNGYIVRHPTHITRKSLAEYQELADAMTQLIDQFTSAGEHILPPQPQPPLPPLTPSSEDPNQGLLF